MSVSGESQEDRTGRKGLWCEIKEEATAVSCFAIWARAGEKQMAA